MKKNKDIANDLNVIYKNEISINKFIDITRMLANIISHELENGNDVKLLGLGIFSVKQMKERNARNPKTGEKMLLKPYNKVKFTASKSLKEIVNIK